LAKDTPIIFSDGCLEALYKFKEALITAPIIQLLDWSLPLKVICDANDVIRVILGKTRDKNPYVIYYASKMLDEAQQNYTTIEELLVVVYAIEKFWPYLLCSKVFTYTNYSTLN